MISCIRNQIQSYYFSSGSIAPYSGGGYAADMGKYPHRAIELIKELKKNMWIDPQTRVVFLEVTTYNAQVNLFAIMNFMVEMLPTDGMVKFYSIKVARLYTFGGSTQVNFYRKLGSF